MFRDPPVTKTLLGKILTSTGVQAVRLWTFSVPPVTWQIEAYSPCADAPRRHDELTSMVGCCGHIETRRHRQRDSEANVSRQPSSRLSGAGS